MFSSKPGRPFWFLLRAAIFLLVFGAVAEVWLRTVMPACSSPLSYQEQPATVFRFDPAGPRTGRWTIGRLCLGGGRWRVNNAGWNSAIDYQPRTARDRPLIALFGDSFVEGFLTDTDEHIESFLTRYLPSADAYAFALSAWYLEQHVAVSRYATRTYAPSLLVVFVDQGDVVLSMRENGVVSPYLWQIATVDGSLVEIPPSAAYVASRKARLAKKSALINYLRYNAKLQLPGMQNAALPQPTGEATAAQGDEAAPQSPGADASWRELLPAADFMVGRLSEQHAGTPIIFVGYGNRPVDRYLPLDDIADTPLFADARAVQAACKGRPQCSFIDLRYAFSRDWAANHVRFEAADGRHWNAHANRMVARTLADFVAQNDLLPAAE